MRRFRFEYIWNQKETLIFRDYYGNIILYNFLKNSLQFIQNIISTRQFIQTCSSYEESFLIMCVEIEDIWYFTFYSALNDSREHFANFHESWKPPTRIQSIDDIFFYKGVFYLLYSDFSGNRQYQYLFREISKLYKSIEMMYYQKKHVQYSFDCLHTMIQKPLPENISSNSENQKWPKCCICLTNNVNVLFIPCNHCVCCLACMKNLEKNECPICRTNIYVKRFIYV
jgi:hypothetical protein